MEKWIITAKKDGRPVIWNPKGKFFSHQSMFYPFAFPANIDMLRAELLLADRFAIEKEIDNTTIREYRFIDTVETPIINIAYIKAAPEPKKYMVLIFNDDARIHLDIGNRFDSQYEAVGFVSSKLFQYKLI